MEPTTNKDVAARVLKVLALLLLIFFAAVTVLLLFTLLPMLILDGNMQIDSGGFLDLLLQRTQHASAVIPGSLIFLGTLPLILDSILLLMLSIVIYSFLRQVTRRGTWFFEGGKTRWIIAAVFAALTAVLPVSVSALVKNAVAASGTFAVKPWNPAGDILLFAVIGTLAAIYIVKYGRRQTQAEPGEENMEAQSTDLS